MASIQTTASGHERSDVRTAATPTTPGMAGLIALVEQLTARIEVLVSTSRVRLSQDQRLQTEVETLRSQQAALTGSVEALQQRVEALAPAEGGIAQALETLTERVRLLTQGAAAEIVSPRQVIAAAGLAPRDATAHGTQEEPLLVTISSVKTEGEVRQLREAIEHLPSVAALDSGPLDAGTVTFTVRLRETWPRSSFTRQMSWLEGLRLSLIFTGPDGLRADLLSAGGSASRSHSEPGSWFNRLLRRREGGRPSAVGHGAV
jgi:FtsZ-binding cell division protein ZapB